MAIQKLRNIILEGILLFPPLRKVFMSYHLRPGVRPRQTPSLLYSRYVTFE
jgi:hypothetical protein